METGGSGSHFCNIKLRADKSDGSDSYEKDDSESENLSNYTTVKGSMSDVLHYNLFFSANLEAHGNYQMKGLENSAYRRSTQLETSMKNAPKKKFVTSRNEWET